MKNWRSRWTFLGLIILCFPLLRSQCSEEPRFMCVGAQQGLSQNTVHDVIQDSVGFLWIGTQDGLNLYDGYHCITFLHDPDRPGSLSSNWIEALLEDSQGNLWVGARNGLNRMKKDEATFEAFFYQPDEKIENNWIVTLFEDREGRIWAGASGRALHCYNPVDESFKTYKLAFDGDPADLSLEFPYTIAQDRDGMLWVGSDKLILFNPETGAYEDKSALLGGAAQLKGWIKKICMETDERKTMLIGSLGMGVFRYDLDEGLKAHFKAADDNPSSLPSDTVDSIYKDSMGAWWAGTANGLARFDPNTGHFTTYRHNPSDPESLTDNRILSIMEDRTGIMWFGTSSGGLNGYERSKNRFNHFHTGSGLSYNDVGALFVDRNDRLWVSTFDSKLNLYHPDTNAFTTYSIQVPDDNEYVEVSAIRDDDQGRLWLGTRGQGLIYWDMEEGVLNRYLPEEGNPESAPDTYVNSLYRDKAGALWVGGYYRGLSSFIDGVFTHYIHDDKDPQSISGNTIWSMAEDKNGDLWVGAYSGLNRLNRQTGQFTRYQHSPNNPASLCNNGVGAILFDSKDRLWVGTDNGLDRKEGDRFIHHNHLGLPSQVIYGILEDTMGFLWMSTNKGLVRFDPDAEVIRVFTPGEGVQGYEFNSNSYCKSPNGLFHFGGINGFNSFQPESIVDDPYRPNVVVTELLLFNQRVYPGPEMTGLNIPRPIHAIKELRFSHEDKFITFHFSALHFANPAKNSYAYQLEGFTDWITTDASERLATFTNIPPGSYTFRVKASNKDGLWNEEGAAIKVTVAPPPWKSPMAYLFYFLAAGLLIFGYLRAEARLKHTLETRVATRTLELKKKNEELDLRYWELASLDDIVININREEELDVLLGSLLEQATVLFPMAEKGLFIMREDGADTFQSTVSIGYSSDRQDQDALKFSDLESTYLAKGTAVCEGVSLVVQPEPLKDNQEWCYMSMTIEVDGRLDGLLVLGMPYKPGACDNTDSDKLVRFRQHTLSAVAKARSLQKLKRQNQEIMAKQNQLVIQEKMASLGTLAAGIAHELKNPLNFVNGLSEVCIELLDELEEKQDKDLSDQEVAQSLKQNLAVVLKNGKRAIEIVDKMMEISKSTPGVRQQICINHLLKEHVGLAISGIKARTPEFEVEVIEDFDESIPEWDVSSESLRRVFIHLLNNALESLEAKAMKREDAAYRPTLALQTRRRGSKVEMTIRDNGMGIAKENMDRVLDYFFTTWDPDKGHIGLGLPISYDIIRRHHGGDLRFKSEKGAFAEVQITMPLFSS